MTTFLGSVWWLIVSIGILVTLHELGHFWMARRFGVTVERFSIGFGKALWERRGRDGTVYAVGAIPLGGYVRMLGETQADDGDAAPAPNAEGAYNRKPVWQRMLIAAAGPAMNLLLCVVFLWVMLVLGRPDYSPMVGATRGPAAQAGLREGDRLLSVDGRATPTWSEATLGLAVAASERRDVSVQVRSADGHTQARVLRLSTLPVGIDDADAVHAIGITPLHRSLPPVIGTVAADSAAAGVLQPGDRVLAVNDAPLRSFDALGARVQAAAAAGAPLHLRVQRQGEQRTLEVTPRRMTDGDGRTRWVLGVTPQAAQAPPPDTVLRHGPLAAVPLALRETGHLFHQTVAMLARLFTGRASTRNVSGPITIARYANASASLGPAWFLNFLALLSLSLGIMNLLPVPVLDGGQLVLLAAEGVKGAPLSDRALAIGQYASLVFLAGLMGLAFYNDILGLLG